MSINDWGIEVLKKASRQKFGTTGAADGLTQDDVNFEYVISTEDDDTRYVINEVVNSSKTFIGKTFENDNPDKSAAIWQIQRITKVGTETTTEFANDGKYNQIWDDREDLFPTVSLDFAKSINFDGINDYLTGGNVHNYDHSNAFSVSMWVKPQNVSANRILFSKAGSAPNVRGYMLRHNTGGAIFIQLRSSGANRSHTFTSTLTASVWQHLVFTYDGGSNINGARVYIDASVGDTPSSGGLSGSWLEGQDFLIAQRTGTFFYSGNIDEVTVWDKALTQSEVTELYNSGTLFDPSTHSAAVNLQSYYRMGDGDTFPTITDNVGSDDLTMINMDSGDIEDDSP